MATNFRTPGVYRQDVFLRAPVKLPTGIPAFVGFAAASARLSRLPPSLVFPARLRERMSYDSGRGLLTFVGVMTEADLAELSALSVDATFTEAVRTLSRNARAVVAIHRREEFFDHFSPPPGGFLGEAVAGFFQNGGVRCYVSRATPPAAPSGRAQALKDALDALEPLTDLDLVVVPDVMTINVTTDDPGRDAANPVPDLNAILDVQAYALQHCAKNIGRFVILDSAPGASVEGVTTQRDGLSLRADETLSGALYFPWLRTTAGRLIPPSGHVAGVYARTDGKVGVFKAPANEELLGVLDLEPRVTTEMQDVLNPIGVNCVRAFAGRGIRVWGARTLSRDANWRYVNVRRLFLTVCRWVDLNMPWATYEPNEPRLWVRIQRELGSYLRGLWETGALVGQTPAEAFYVKCDAETNPPESREAGMTVTEIGIAPSAPAEFVVVRILHRAGTSEAQ